MRTPLRRLRSWAGTLLLLATLTCSGFGRIAITQTATAEIPQATPLEVLLQDVGFGDFVSMDIANDAQLQNQGVSRNQISTVFLSALTLQILEPPSGQDFTFIDSLEFYVESPGIDRVRIASGGPFPAGETIVELTVDEVDLAEYVAAESMTITTEASGSRPEDDTTIEATAAFDVGFDLEGAVCGGGGEA